jgi:TRAP-type uncharacterized transport system substrate-binding protein
VRLATAPLAASDGGYYEIGRQYQELLARTGVELRLVATAGSVENLALLRDPHSGVNIALVQGGGVGEAAAELESLGTLFYEPLWIFHRGGLEGATLAALRGRKVSIGPVGSGSHALLLKLLKRNDVDQDVGELLALPPQEAADKLFAGEIDAAAMLASWDAPVVQQLIADERVELLNLARADAYVALYPFLSKATVPRGVGDLAKDLPPADVTLFASKASLVVRKDLHSAIQYLLLSTAVQIHSGVSMFHRARSFPGSRRHRTATQQPGRSVLQIRAAVPAAQSSVLDGVAGRTSARPAHPDRRRAVPANAVSACFVWVVDAPEDRATVR